MIIYDMPEAQYHAETGVGPGKWVTRSIIKDYEESPSLCKLALEGHPMAVRSYNAGMSMGTVFEAVFCGKEDRLQINDKYKTTQGKSYQAWAQDVIADGLIPATQADYDLSLFLVARFHESAMGKWVLGEIAAGNAKFQVVYRWEERGVPCQAMVDVLISNLPIDVKTGRMPWRRFPSIANDYGYDLQDTHYVAGMVANGITLPNVTDADPYGYMPFAYVQTARPYEARIIRLPAEQRDYASVRRIRVLENLAGDYWEAPDALMDKPLCPDLPAYITMRYGCESYPGE